MSEISETQSKLDELMNEYEMAVIGENRGRNRSGYSEKADKYYQKRRELKEFVGKIEGEYRWHVVDDGDLPIVGKSIMFYDSSSKEIYRGVYTASHHWRANYFSEKCGTVTHWMPLPKLPEVQE